MICPECNIRMSYMCGGSGFDRNCALVQYPKTYYKCSKCKKILSEDNPHCKYADKEQLRKEKEFMKQVRKDIKEEKKENDMSKLQKLCEK